MPRKNMLLHAGLLEDLIELSELLFMCIFISLKFALRDKIDNITHLDGNAHFLKKPG
jgi:hypothetical protein